MSKTKNFHELPQIQPFSPPQKSPFNPCKGQSKGQAKEKSLEIQRLQDFFLAEKEGFERKSIDFLGSVGVAVYARIAQNKGLLRIVEYMESTME